MRPHPDHELYCPPQSSLARDLSSQKWGAPFLLAAFPSYTRRGGGRGEQTRSLPQTLGEKEGQGRTPRPSSLGTPASRCQLGFGGAPYDRARPARPRTRSRSQLAAAEPRLLPPGVHERGQCQLLAAPTADRVPGTNRWLRRGARDGRAHSPRR